MDFFRWQGKCGKVIGDTVLVTFLVFPVLKSNMKHSHFDLLRFFCPRNLSFSIRQIKFD